MQIDRKYLGYLALATISLFAQDKPKVTIKALPSEPIATGNCTFSTSGYLEENGKTADFTDAEFGHMILPALRQGNVVTIYPPTKRGIFASAECHSAERLTLRVP